MGGLDAIVAQVLSLEECFGIIFFNSTVRDFMNFGQQTKLASNTRAFTRTIDANSYFTFQQSISQNDDDFETDCFEPYLSDL